MSNGAATTSASASERPCIFSAIPRRAGTNVFAAQPDSAAVQKNTFRENDKNFRFFRKVQFLTEYTFGIKF